MTNYLTQNVVLSAKGGEEDEEDVTLLFKEPRFSLGWVVKSQVGWVVKLQVARVNRSFPWSCGKSNYIL